MLANNIAGASWEVPIEPLTTVRISNRGINTRPEGEFVWSTAWVEFNNATGRIVNGTTAVWIVGNNQSTIVGRNSQSRTLLTYASVTQHGTRVLTVNLPANPSAEGQWSFD